MPPINESIKTRIVYLLGCGWSIRRIADDVQRTPSSVQYVVNKYKTTGHINRLPGSGRPPKIDADKRHRILQYFIDHPTDSYEECLRSLNITDCSTMFVSQLLAENGMRAYVEVVVESLSAQSISKRLVKVL